MRFIALLEQGQGCDYTIGCGKEWIEFDSLNNETALAYLKETIKEEYSYSERRLSTIKLIGVSFIADINAKEIYTEIDKENLIAELEEKETQERELLRKLTEKYKL